MTTRIKLRRDISTNWTDANPVLALGEAGIVTDTLTWKIGDGTTAWNDLPYMAGDYFNGEIDGLTLTGTIPYVDDVLVASPVTFTRPNNSPNTVDAIDTGLTIKRANNNGAIYNSAGGETNWNNSVSPLGTEWNADGWADLADVKARTYTTFNEACNGIVGEVVTHREFVMHDTINDKYYTVKFSWWQPGNNYGQGYGGAYTGVGGLTYVRQLINTDPSVYFVRPVNSESTVDDIGPGLSIKRDSAGGGIYNSQEDAEWDADTTPYGTLWNDEGWDDLTDITTRTWKPFYAAVHGRLGEHVVGRELLMNDTINNKYYVIKFTDWGQSNGGSFAYWRREINSTGTRRGITFADGSLQTVAFNPGEMTIDDNRITSRQQDITIETVTDPLVNADINIRSSNNIWTYAGGEYGIELQSANTVSIGTGDSEFIGYDNGTIYWTGTNIVVDSYDWWIEPSLQLYLTDTYNLWFRDELGTWHRTYSTTIATYDSTATTYTIPIAVNNTGTQLYVTNIELRDPDYQGDTWWNFNRNGYLNPPQMDVTGWHPWNTYNQPTLKLGYPNTDVAITNADVNTDQRGGYSIKIMGQRGYGHWNDTTGNAGNGTDIQIWAGAGGESSTPDQGGEGGNIDIHAGQGQGGRDGGGITITAGNASFSMENTSTNQVSGGTVEIRAGDALEDVVAEKGHGGNVSITAGRGNITNGYVSINTSIDSSTYISWVFGTDGGTLFPTLSTQRGDNPSGTISGQTLLFANRAYEAVISTQDGDSTFNDSQRLVINPGAGYHSGEGGDIYLWAGRGGDASGTGGDIKIRGGHGGYNTNGGIGGDGGYIRIEGGTPANTGGQAGYIEITGGAGTTATIGGSVSITGGSNSGIVEIYGGHADSGLGGSVTIGGGGSNSGSSSEGPVIVETGGNTWTFGNTGTVTFPDATVQTTAYPSGQMIIQVNTATANDAVFINTLTGTVLTITPEQGYIDNAGQGIFLPTGTDSIAIGTRITIMNWYAATANITGWDGPPYGMAPYETISLVYYYDPNYPGKFWWITSSFSW